jgi:threonine/homoserine/homoserine lactone efflux protein
VAEAPAKPAGQFDAFTAIGGFLLGISNPKAYLAFVSLMGSYVLVTSATTADAAVKWGLCVLVIIVVDLVWLWIGHKIGRISLIPRHERAMNLVMGGLILGAAILSLI